MPITKLSPTEEQIKELVEIEEVLACLDQHASSMGPAPSRAFSRWYEELVKLRETALRDWNEEASCGLKDLRRMLYRCDQASHPYHTTEDDGPCEVYTPNWDASAGKGAVSLCELHVQMAEDEADRARAELDAYRMARQRGEDV